MARKKLVVWLDDDGESHISTPESYGSADYDLLFVIEFEEEASLAFFSDLDCEDEIGVEINISN